MMDEEPNRILSWPGSRRVGYAARLSVLLNLWFYLIYGGADWITARRTVRFQIDFEFERYIPFVPASVVIYLSFFLLFALAPFVLRTVRELNVLAVTIMSAVLLAGVCFLLFPAELAYPGVHDWGIWHGPHRIADRMNLQYNLAPSLHVTLTIICVDLFSQHASRLGKSVLWIWGLAIALSTLLTHEHHLIDVASGFLLALLSTRCIHPRLLAPTDREVRPQAE